MNNLKRFSISAILFLMAYLALGTSTAMAVPVYGYNNETCYDSITYHAFALSVCARVGSTTATTAAATTLQATSPSIQRESIGAYTIVPLGSSGGGSLDAEHINYYLITTTDKDGNVSTTFQECHQQGVSSEESCGVSPAEGHLTVQNLSTNLSNTQTKIASGASLLGSEQKMSTTGFAVSYSRDIGDWSYAVALPIRRTNNNKAYSALDNTQIGLVFSPTYHLFLEQVHGLTVNLGAVLGYTHTKFSDVSAVRDPTGAYKLTDFSNLDTSFAGLNASLGKQLSSKARLNLSMNAMAYNNDGTVSMGNNGSILNTTAGLNYLLSEKVTAGAQYNLIRLHQNSFDTTSSYNSLGANLRYAINRRSSLAGSFDTMIGSENLKTKTYMLNYQLEM